MRVIVLLALCCAAVAAAPRHPSRIIGGDLTTIDKYPSMAAILKSSTLIYFGHACGGTIINNRSVLTAAYCIDTSPIIRVRIRVGSSFAHSEGQLLQITAAITHPEYDFMSSHEHDVAIYRTMFAIEYNENVGRSYIAGSNYNLADNEVVWATGWGITELGTVSEQLREVQVWTVNQEICKTRYANVNETITPNMLCTGWLDVGGRDQCVGDSGGPVFHHDIVVGVSSFGEECALPEYPRVNARVSSYTSWIQEVADNF